MIERQAREEVSHANDGCVPRSAYGIAAVLNAWEAAVVTGTSAGPLRALLASRLRCQLQRPLDIRNGLCHGLTGLSSARGGKPAVLTWSINGSEQSITWDELQTDFSWLSKVPSAILMISNSPGGTPGSRMTDSPENRAWWQAEYGIDVIPTN
jgi:hypothetical protein